MLIIGERINSTRKSIAPAVKERNAALIQEEAKKQAEAGAHYIDCNAAAAVTPEEEPETLCWLVETVQAAVDLPISIDSPNPKAIEAAIKVHRGTPIINSITGEGEKFDRLLPLVLEHKAKAIALCMDDEGMPKTGEDRIRIGLRLIERLLSAGVPEDDLIVDPLLLPIGVDPQHGNYALQAIAEFKRRYPNVKVSFGLTNVSFGLPERKWLNRAMLVLAMGAGLDCVICDPTDKDLMALLLAAEALLGKDEFCANYISAARAGKLGGSGKIP